MADGNRGRPEGGAGAVTSAVATRSPAVELARSRRRHLVLPRRAHNR